MSLMTSTNVLRLPRTDLVQPFEADEEAFCPSTLPVYRLLVRDGQMCAPELASILGAPLNQILDALGELESLRLIRRYGSGFVAVPREQAADEIFTEQTQRLSEALDGLSRRQRQLRSLFRNRANLDEGVHGTVSQVVIGQGEHRELFEMPSDPERSLNAIHPGGLFDSDLLEASLKTARANLARGVRLRAVHQTSALGHPRMVQYLTQIVDMGGRVGLRNNLPARLLLIDDVSAICSLPSNAGGTQMFTLRGTRVVALLAQMFESTWVEATPLETALESKRECQTTQGYANEEVAVAQPDIQLNPLQESILRHLAEGQTDHAIARLLGITTRTVTRRIAEIYTMLGVESRFQAGMAARRCGVV